MTEPKRLLDGASGLELDLLRAGRDDEPPRGAEHRAAIALGLAAGVAVGTTTTTATAAATKATWFGASAVAIKAVSITVATGVVAAVAVHTAIPSRSTPARAPREIVAPSSRASTPTARASAPEVPPPVRVAPAMKVEQPALAIPRPAAQRPQTAAEHGAVLPGPTVNPLPTTTRSVGDEIALLDRARAAWSSGDAARALELVDEFDAKFRGSSFELESRVLRIDSLDALGQRSLALDTAERFLAAHPNESMSQHVRSTAERIRKSMSNP